MSNEKEPVRSSVITISPTVAEIHRQCNNPQESPAPQSLQIGPDATTGILATYGANNEGLWKIACAPDHRHVITSSANGKVKFFDMFTGSEGAVHSLSNNIVYMFIFVDNGTAMITCSSDKTVQKWSIPNDVMYGKVENLWKVEGFDNYVLGVSVSETIPDLLLVATAEKVVFGFSIAEGVQKWKYEYIHKNWIWTAVERDSLILTASDDQTCQIFDLHNPKQHRKHYCFHDRCLAANFLPGTSKKFACSTTQSKVFVCSVNEKDGIVKDREFIFQASGWIRRFSFAPGAFPLMAVAAENGGVFVVNLETEQVVLRVKNPRRDETHYMHAEFCSSSSMLLMASTDNGQLVQVPRLLEETLFESIPPSVLPRGILMEVCDYAAFI